MPEPIDKTIDICYSMPMHPIDRLWQLAQESMQAYLDDNSDLYDKVHGEALALFRQIEKINRDNVLMWMAGHYLDATYILHRKDMNISYYLERIKEDLDDYEKLLEGTCTP